MGIRALGHIGYVVDDPDHMARFFLDLGCVPDGGGRFASDWVDSVLGLTGVELEIVTVRTPDGHTQLEFTKYVAPRDGVPADHAPVSRHGVRHVAFEVDDLDGCLDVVRAHGLDLVGRVTRVDESFRFVYVRGPEGFVVELAERLTAP
jgi:catechol 2,3-dioxygenase-like lactoylglutathione lyase family enzyme